MNLERHEAGHAIVAHSLGWRVAKIVVNERGGTTYVQPPADLSPWSHAWQNCLIAIAGEMAEFPHLTMNELKSVLSGKDREDFRRDWPKVWRDTNPYLKRRLFESMYRAVKQILADNAAEVDALAERLETFDVEGPGPRRNDPPPEVIANRAAEVRGRWSPETIAARRQQMWGNRVATKSASPHWTPPVVAVASIRPEPRNED